MERLQLQGVDGILVIVSEQEAAEALLSAPAEVPLVAVEAGPDSGVPVVAVDQHAGAMLATRHLLELGHETVWHVAGPPASLESAPADRRLAGGADAGRRADPPAAGRRLERALGLRARAAAEPRSDAVTAVFVGNDQMALGVLRAMHEARRRIPDDVSIVGFDDIPESPYFTPPLTTVRQDFGEVGSRSLRVLVPAVETFKAGERPPDRLAGDPGARGPGQHRTRPALEPSGQRQLTAACM